MCGRYSLSTPGDELARVFEVAPPAALAPRYNIAPTQEVPIVRAEATRELLLARWGLVPSWADDPAIGARLINARAETIAEKPAFRAAFKRRRCLVLADGFYEWQRVGARKQPYYIRRRDGRPFAFAGLWERWEAGGAAVTSCALITTTPNELIRPIHDRMPVILEQADLQRWLEPTLTDIVLLKAMLKPHRADALVAFPVSAAVNSPSHDSAACVAPLAP